MRTKFEGERSPPPSLKFCTPTLRGRSPLKVSKERLGQLLGYFRLGLARFSTITRELRVVEMNRLQIRGPEKISYPIRQSCFWVKKLPKQFFFTLKIHKKKQDNFFYKLAYIRFKRCSSRWHKKSCTKDGQGWEGATGFPRGRIYQSTFFATDNW